MTERDEARKKCDLVSMVSTELDHRPRDSHIKSWKAKEGCRAEASLLYVSPAR